jgi:hypothetical protein
MKYLEIAASERPRAAVVLMAGGNGVLGLSPSGEIGTDLKLNFLMRTRERFVRAGMVVAALDVASDQMGGLNGDIRLSGRHAHDIVKVIADLRRRHNVPVWLVGTSASTISAVSVAARFADPKSGGPEHRLQRAGHGAGASGRRTSGRLRYQRRMDWGRPYLLATGRRCR